MSIKTTINIAGEIIDLTRPKVMGIINLTPDSFYAGSRRRGELELLKTAEGMLNDGATFLDIGGYSSRPGAEDISEEVELERVVKPIEMLAKTFPRAIISIDTFRSEVAKHAVNVGAHMVNDISGGHLDDQMLATIAALKVPYVAMHMRGTPQSMRDLIEYDDILREVIFYFSNVISKCNELGIHDVLIDPGFGFAKTADQSYFLLKNLNCLQILEKPLLVGVSRKSMIFKKLEIEAEKALNGTTVLNTLALLKGASILRVHDVKEATQAIKLIELVK